MMTAEAQLNDLWEGYRSKWRRLLSPKMIRELTLRASFDVDPINPRKIANNIPKGRVPDCNQCEDICCAGVTNVVSLRLADIAVLIDIERTDLITKKKPRFSPVMIRRKPQLQDLMDSELWRTLPVLRQVGEQRICAALTPELKCSLYPHWPTSCARFPYTLSKARKAVFWGKRCPVYQEAVEHVEQSESLFARSVSGYNERIRDAVLLHHARKDLDRIGLGAWLTGSKEDPFEPVHDPRNAEP
jgi:Fe-S-cluster containining protein